MAGNPTLGAVFLTGGSSSDISLVDNTDPAYLIHEGANEYERISTLNAAEKITWGNTGAVAPDFRFNLKTNSALAMVIGTGAQDFIFADATTADLALTYGSSSGSGPRHRVELPDNKATSLVMAQGADVYEKVDTTNGAERITWGTSGSTVVPSYTFQVPDNLATAWQLFETGNAYVVVSTANAAERVTFGNTGATTPSFTFQVKDNNATAFQIKEAATAYLTVLSSNGSERVRLDAAVCLALSARGTPSGGTNEGLVYGGTSGANTELSYREPNTGQDINLTSIGELWAQNALRVEERGTDPATVANAGKLYAKDVSTITELFWVNSSGTVVQITSGASLARDISIPDNTAVAYRIKEGANNYLLFDTSNASEAITLANATTRQRVEAFSGVFSISAANTQNAAFQISDAGSAVYFQVDTSTTAANRKISVGRNNGGTTIWSQFIRNAASAFSITIGGADEVMRIDAAAGAESIIHGNATANCPTHVTNLRDNKSEALIIQEGANKYFVCTTTNGAETVIIAATPAGCDLSLGNSTTTLSLFGVAGGTQPTITGSRATGAALADLLTKGAVIGYWVDGTSA